MRILVTGGAGFIGSHFVKYVLTNYPDYKIFNIDKLTYAGNLKNLSDIAGHTNYQFIKADINNTLVVSRLLAQCDSVVHFAAETHVDRSIKNTQDFISTNFHGTYVLLEGARKNKIQRFVHVSTDEVYGSRPEGFFREDAPLNPSSPYSASKAAADLLVRSYFMTFKLPGMITRCSNNFGPYQYPEKIIPLFVTNLLENKKVPLYAQGHNVRDWIYVEDHCRAVDLVLHKGAPGEIYNIAGENYQTNIALTQAILKNMNKPLSMIQNVPDRPGHDFRYAIDSSKIRQLGFRPRVSFEQGLQQTIEWYKHNHRWWKKLKKK